MIVFDFAIDCLQGTIPDGEDAIPDNVSFLLRKDRLESHRADFSDRLDSVIAAGDAGGDVTRGGRLKRHVADLEPLQELASLPLVVNGNVVRGVELALRVVIEIDVNPLGDDPA